MQKKNIKKMKFNYKKLLVISIGVIILIGGIAGIKISIKKKPKTIPHFMTKIDEIVSDINEINKVFDSDKIDLNSPIEDLAENKDLICYVYQGADREDFLKRIESIYVSPTHVFVTVDEKDVMDGLYVCKPKYCGVAEFSSDEIVITKDDAEGIKGKVRGQEFELVYDYDENKWKVVNSILTC